MTGSVSFDRPCAPILTVWSVDSAKGADGRRVWGDGSSRHVRLSGSGPSRARAGRKEAELARDHVKRVTLDSITAGPRADMQAAADVNEPALGEGPGVPGGGHGLAC